MQSEITHELLKAAPAGVAARVLGISTGTLRRWRLKGLINATLTEGRHARFDVAEYLARTAKGQ